MAFLLVNEGALCKFAGFEKPCAVTLGLATPLIRSVRRPEEERVRDFVGFHSWGPTYPPERFRSGIDGVAASEGLALVSQKREGAEREYGREGLPTVSFYHDAQRENSQVWGIVTADGFMALGQETVARIFTGVASTLQPTLARSFDELAHGVIKMSELGGDLEFVDWFQYLSPAIVARWGVDALRDAPFASVDILTSGACYLWLRGSPIDVLTGRRAAADALGITLRQLTAKNPKTGEPVIIPWS